MSLAQFPNRRTRPSGREIAEPGVSRPRIALALHEDCGVVTEDSLDEQLRLIRTGAVSPVAGVFGPASMMWRVNREAVIFLAAGRALLLQLAHPWVAAAIAEHSRALSNPVGRFHRTFQVVFAAVFGSLDQAFAAARRLHRRHSQITGTMPVSAGRFRAGSRYAANNISALRWVHATLIESALLAHDLVLGQTFPEERGRYYQESKRFAGLFGIPPDLLPADDAAFSAYTEAMGNSDILTVSDMARHIAEQLFTGAGPGFGVPIDYRALTSSLLPERLCRDFRLRCTGIERRQAARAVGMMRHLYPLLPSRLRYVAPYLEARQRLAGNERPDLATRLGNRIWMGRPSLDC
jgi:uncharacterized protein (DUF2236 family)